MSEAAYQKVLKENDKLRHGYYRITPTDNPNKWKVKNLLTGNETIKVHSLEAARRILLSLKAPIH